MSIKFRIKDSAKYTCNYIDKLTNVTYIVNRNFIIIL